MRRGVDLEVVGLEIERQARAAREGLLQRRDEVDLERLAMAIRLGLLGAELHEAAVIRLMATGAIAQQALVDVAQRELADLPDALRRQTRPPLPLGQVARLHQQHHDVLQELEVLSRFQPKELAQALGVDGVEVAREELLFEALQALHRAHQRQRFLVGERPRPVEEVAVATREVLEIADVVELVEQALERVGRVALLEVVVAQPAERFREAMRQPIEEVVLASRLRPVLEPVEGVAFEVEQSAELLADLGECMAQVHVAIARPHLLAQLLEEVVEPHDAHALLPLEALVQQPIERLLHVVGEGEVLRELLEDVVRGEPDLLRPVPGGVADAVHAGWRGQAR